MISECTISGTGPKSPNTAGSWCIEVIGRRGSLVRPERFELEAIWGVSEAGVRSRNPEPGVSGEGSGNLVRPERFELEAICRRERSGSPQPKS